MHWLIIAHSDKLLDKTVFGKFEDPDTKCQYTF